MAELPDIIVSHSKHMRLERVEMTTSDNTGSLVADFDPYDADFRIERIEVSTPRVGLGKELLMRAEVEARKLKAQKISACIVSAECLASMSHVFGEDSIRVAYKGEFGSLAGDTNAWLDFIIEDSSSFQE